jgi:prefoldin subunit 5
VGLIRAVIEISALVFLVVIIIMIPNEDASAYQYNYDTDLLVTHPGTGGSFYFNTITGDNITVTLWNFTQFTGRTLWLSMGFSASPYEYDSKFISNGLDYRYTFGTTSPTIELWAIDATSNQVLLTCYYQDPDNAGSFNVRISRNITHYSPYYEMQQKIAQIEGMEENITSLNENVTKLNNLTSNLNESMDQLSFQTQILSDTTVFLRENITGLLENITVLKANISKLDSQYLPLIDRLDEMSEQVDHFEATALTMFANQQSLLKSILALWDAHDELNQSVIDLEQYLEELDLENLDLIWVEENLTRINSDITDIQTSLRT